jgi:hypothetical protein
VGNKIYACARLLAREQGYEELFRTHDVMEQGARFGFELEVSADFGGGSSLDLEQRFIAHSKFLPAIH